MNYDLLLQRANRSWWDTYGSSALVCPPLVDKQELVSLSLCTVSGYSAFFSCQKFFSISTLTLKNSIVQTFKTSNEVKWL